MKRHLTPLLFCIGLFCFTSTSISSHDINEVKSSRVEMSSEDKALSGESEYTILDAIKFGMNRKSYFASNAISALELQKVQAVKTFFDSFAPKLSARYTYEIDEGGYYSVDSNNVDISSERNMKNLSNFQISSEFRIFEFFSGFTKIKAVDLGRIAKEFECQNALELHLRDILDAYYDVIYYRRLLIFAEWYNRKMQEIVGIFQELKSSDLVKNSELYAKEIALLNGKVLLSNTMVELRTSEEKFFSIVGHLPPVGMLPINFDNVISYDGHDHFLSLVIKGNSGLRAKQYLKMQATANLKSATLNMFPKFSVAVNKRDTFGPFMKRNDWYDNSYYDKKNDGIFSAVISFDVFSGYPELYNNKIALESGKIELRKEYDKLYNLTSQYFRVFENYKKDRANKIGIYNSYVALLRDAVKQYSMSIIKVSDVIKIHTDFMDMQKSLLESERSYFKNFINMLLLTGYTEVDFDKMVGKELPDYDAIIKSIVGF